MKNTDTDIVIIILPFLFIQPMNGPFYLKSNVEKHGYTCKVIDWNYKLFKHHNHHKNGDLSLLSSKYLFNKKINSYGKSQFELFLPEWIKDIKKYNPKMIGLSINNYNYNAEIDNYLIPPIRKAFPDIKIVAGGSAVDRKSRLNDKLYGQTLVDKKYIDYFVKGEGEEALLSILQNNSWDNNNPLKRLTNLKDIKAPDYSDITDDILHNKSLKNNERYIQFPITSVRGCPRNCNYCMYNMKKGFQLVPAENVVNELLDLTEKYGINNFRFVDSLSNVSSKHLLEISSMIINKKKKGYLKDISWTANMCCFPRRKYDTLLYQLMKESGCKIVNVGIESGSNKVREDMNKKIKDEDIYFMIDHLNKNNIICWLHLLIGFYSEIDEDFLMTIDMIKKFHSILGDNLIVDLGVTFQIDNITKWNYLGIKDDKIASWKYGDNTFILRCRRWLKIYKLCTALKIRVETGYSRILYNTLKKYENIEDLKYLRTQIKRIR